MFRAKIIINHSLDKICNVAYIQPHCVHVKSKESLRKYRKELSCYFIVSCQIFLLLTYLMYLLLSSTVIWR